VTRCLFAQSRPQLTLQPDPSRGAPGRAVPRHRSVPLGGHRGGPDARLRSALRSRSARLCRRDAARARGRDGGGTAALIEAAPGLGDGDFATYTARMLARLPVLEALEWSPRGSAGEPAREEALQRAVETGEVTISDPIHAARAEPGGWSFLLVAPVRAPPPAETERRPPVRGFAIGVVRFADLIAAAFSERATTGGGRLAWQLAGEDAGGRGVVLWSSVTSGAVEEPRAGASLQRTIVAGGQRWTLVARPTDSALRAGRSSSPALLGAASFSGWQLLVALERGPDLARTRAPGAAPDRARARRAAHAAPRQRRGADRRRRPDH